MDDRDFHVELDTVGRDMDRRYFFKLLGSTGALVGSIGIALPDPPEQELLPVAEPEPVEMLRLRLMNADQLLAETMVPTRRAHERGAVRWYCVGKDWTVKAEQHGFRCTDIQVRIPQEISEALDMPEDVAWRSMWAKDGMPPVELRRGDSMTVKWAHALLEFAAA